MLISLVIPVRNEEKSLGRLVDSIRSQVRRPDEVVLVDGGSTDRTVDLARELCSGDPHFRVIEAGDATPGRGRNVGIAAASHDWVALTDAGIRLEPGWLERLAAVVRADPETDVVFGNFAPLTRTFFEQCASLSYVPPARERPGGRMRGPFIASTLLRRSVWDAVGGFPDLRAAEDLIFIRAIERGGFRLGWAPGATVWWELRPTLASTFRRFVLYSKANVLAGQQRYWHYGVARIYLLAVPPLGLAVVHSGWWVALPVAAAAARVAKSILDRREERGLAWALNPARFAGVALILAAIDLATFVGWYQARLGAVRPRRGPGHAAPIVGGQSRSETCDQQPVV